MSVESGSVWECRVSVLCERVKEEPGLEQEASPACARVKQEQEASPACARVKQEADGRTEPGGGAADLYVDHEVKDELVLGPTVLQPPDVAFAPTVTLDNAEHIANPTTEGCGRSPCPSPSCEDQLQPRACFVSLERLPADKMKNANSTTLSPSVKRQTSSEIELKGLFKGCAVGDLYSCDACGEQFAQKRSLIRHIRLHSTAIHTQASTGSVPNIVRNYRSSGAPIRNLSPQLFKKSNGSCMKTSVNRKYNLSRHEYIHTGEKPRKPYKCEVCQKQCAGRSQLIRHKRTHTGEKPYKCAVCQKQFSQSSNLHRHRIVHTGERPYKCELCQKQFKERKQLIAHEYIHTGEKPYKCAVCQKQFSRSSNLHRHRIVHTGERPYKCEVCQKQCALRSELIRHKRTHTGEKPYKCAVCQKQFSQSSHLHRHRIVHTGERPYKCELCQKQFRERQQLIAHEYIHTCEKPYKCEVCQKQYALRRPWIRHKRVHTGEKPYECDICSKQYSDRHSLIYHIQGHVGLRVSVTRKGRNPLACAICGARFDKRVRLLRHARGHIWPPERYKDGSLDAEHRIDPTAKENGQNPIRSPRPGASCGDQLLLRPSFKLQRLPPDVEKHANSTTLRSYVKRQTSHEASAASELYSCDSCGEGFAQKRNLILHIQLHSSYAHTQAPTGHAPDVVHDDMRSRPTATSSGLIQNLNESYSKSSSNTETLVTLIENSFVPYELGYTGERSLKCRYCIKRFYVRSAVVRHERIHTGEKPYKCDICPKQFTVNSSLISHKRIHTGEKPYKCDICLMQFAQSSNLISHKRIHTGEKPYKCDICLMQFARSGNLISHKRIHTGEKPYKCEYCTKRFIQKSALAGHERTHTGHKPFKCDICLKQFSRRLQLGVHKNRSSACRVGTRAM